MIFPFRHSTLSSPLALCPLQNNWWSFKLIRAWTNQCFEPNYKLTNFNQSINQSIEPTINRQLNQSINQSITQSIDQSINRSINRSIDCSTTESNNVSWKMRYKRFHVLTSILLRLGPPEMESCSMACGALTAGLTIDTLLGRNGQKVQQSLPPFIEVLSRVSVSAGPFGCELSSGLFRQLGFRIGQIPVGDREHCWSAVALPSAHSSISTMASSAVMVTMSDSAR